MKIKQELIKLEAEPLFSCSDYPTKVLFCFNLKSDWRHLHLTKFCITSFSGFLEAGLRRRASTLTKAHCLASNYLQSQRKYET